MNNDQMTQTAINTVRTLSIDAVEAAKSGHPLGREQVSGRSAGSIQATVVTKPMRIRGCAGLARYISASPATDTDTRGFGDNVVAYPAERPAGPCRQPPSPGVFAPLMEGFAMAKGTHVLNDRWIQGNLQLLLRGNCAKTARFVGRVLCDKANVQLPEAFLKVSQKNI